MSGSGQKGFGFVDGYLMQKIAHYVSVKISNPGKFAGQTQAGGRESQSKYLISIRNERRLPEF